MEETSQPTVKSISMKWGVISGLAGIIFFVLLDFLGQTDGPLRWAGLLITAAIMALAHKAFKEEGDGFMSFGQGLGIGTLMSLIGSILSSIFTYIYISFINTNYLEAMRDKAILDMQEQGNSAEQIDQAMSFMEWMFSPVSIAIMSVVGGVIMGFIVALLVTIFTKKQNPELI